MSERINLVLEDGIGELMTDLAGGERRRGQWLSDLVRAMSETKIKAQQGGDLDTLRYSVVGLAAEAKITEGRLTRLEKQVAAFIAMQWACVIEEIDYRL